MASSNSHVGQAESEEDGMIRVAAFRKARHSPMPWLINFDPQSFNINSSGTPTTLPTSMSSPVAPTGKFSGMGILDKLPNELLTDVCRDLDIRSYLRLRQTCRFFWFFMASLTEYRVVVDHAAPSLIGVVRTDMWQYLTFTDLFRAMCLAHCETCGAIGHFLYLPTATRCCPNCLHEEDKFRTVTLASYVRVSGVALGRVQRLVPLLSSISCNRYRSMKLINFDEATRIMSTPTTLDVGRGYASFNLSWQSYTRNMASTPLPFFDKSTRAVFKALTCKGCARDYSLVATSPLVQQIQLAGSV
ncbi:hypothetical protein CONLIGDRAFT_706523 [Coniochaeta ligniaria NRRL 30616]|uniref:F-box domain-containing protein n=1 Tax=Coniochaeta ligniaria NRRL 30616 TaxID=1408157 RepID=A0A1J7IZ42_9PEZI|nr:hypothetical protein CONLIGDRAFT_706523 [Coniochaeta ligniaria NRRL 30616]